MPENVISSVGNLEGKCTWAQVYVSPISMCMLKGDSLTTKRNRKRMNDTSKAQKYQAANNEVNYNFIAACPELKIRRKCPREIFIVEDE